jgi:transcription elongation GreA/GreB family factor
VSPIAKALIKARIGDEVWFATPGGKELLEVVAVTYK